MTIDYESDDYTSATVIHAEGARVQFVSCKRCGAALLLDPRDDIIVTKLHDEWHEREAQIDE